MSAKRTDQPWLRPQSSRRTRPPILTPDLLRLPSAASFSPPPVNLRRPPQGLSPPHFVAPGNSSPNLTLHGQSAYTSRAQSISSPTPQNPALNRTVASYTNRQDFRSSYASPAVHPPPAEPPGGFSPKDRALLDAGYKSEYVQPKVNPTASSPAESTRPSRKRSVRFDMAEPRARAARHKGQMNFGPESKPPFPQYKMCNPSD